MADPIITSNGLTRRFDNAVAVDGLTLEVYPGEVFGFLGHNGAGKTTTVRLLNGVLTPSAGQARVLGLDPMADGPALRRQTGVLTETPSLDERLSARLNLSLYADLYGVPKAQVKKRVDELLAAFDLTERADDKAGEYSKGMKQRLALARTVLHEPTLLFLDEPTAGLDVGSRVELHSLMRELQGEGTTILLATHDMAEAEGLASRVAILLRGQIAATGTPLEITAAGAGLTKVSVNTEQRCLEQANGAIPGVRQFALKEDYVVYFSADVGATVPALIGYVQSHGDTLIDLRVERPSLEDRFLEITNGGRARSETGPSA